MKKNYLIACTVLVSFLSGTSIAQDLNQNLLLHYKFEGNYTDATFNGNDGINFGTTFVPDKNGNPNSAVYFNGIDNYIALPNVQQLKPSLPVSIAFWINYDNNTYEDSTVFNTSFQENVNSGIYMNCQSTTSQINISYGDGTASYTPSTRRTYASEHVIDPGVWHQVTIVVNGATDMKIYIDCYEAGGFYSGSGGDLEYSLMAGNIGRHDRSMSTLADYFKGTIDEFMYWDRALTESDVTELCNLFTMNNEIVTSSEIQFHINQHDQTMLFTPGTTFDNYTIYCNTGQVITTDEYSTSIPLNTLTKGIYFIKFSKGNNVSQTKKFIIN